MKRNNTQNNTKTHNTQSGEQNIQNKKITVKRILKNIKRITKKKT